jgi:hypothetical protein
MVNNKSKMNKEVTGRIIISKVKRLINRMKMFRKMKETQKICKIKSKRKSFLINKVMIISQENLLRGKWMRKMMIVNNLKNCQIKMMKENKINKLKFRTHNNQWKNKEIKIMKKKRKRNKLKIENSMKGHMEGKTTSLKIIILSMNRK